MSITSALKRKLGAMLGAESPDSQAGNMAIDGLETPIKSQKTGDEPDSQDGDEASGTALPVVKRRR